MTPFSLKTSRTLKLFSLLFILQGLLGPKTLYAISRDSMGFERSTAIRQLANTPSKIRVEGELSCATAEAANGGTTTSNCTLNIKERNTGKTYQLTGQNEPAQKLFENGTKNVAVEGTLSNDSTLNVQTTQAL